MTTATAAHATPVAARLVEEGLALHRAGHLDEARAVYERVLALAPHPVSYTHLTLPTIYSV